MLQTAEKTKMKEENTSPIRGPSCGAVLPALTARCPYCDTVFEEGAEKEYMQKLSGIHEDLGDLKYAALRELAAETGESGRFLKKVWKVTIVLVLLGIAGMLFFRHREEKRAAAEYLWARDNYPIMDAYYEAGEYEELYAFYSQAMQEDHDVWQYDHWAFLSALGDCYEAQAILEEEKKRPLSEDDLVWLFYNELNLAALEHRDGLAAHEREYIAKEAADPLADLEERFPMNAEEKEIFSDVLLRGMIPDIKDCKAYIKAHADTLLQKTQ